MTTDDQSGKSLPHGSLAGSHGWATWVNVAAKITIDEALRVVFAQTIHNENFDADEWSVGQAKDLIHAGEMIIREINAKDHK